MDIDRCWEAVKYARRPRIHTFVATSDIHLKYKLRKSRAEVLKAAVEAVKHARGYCADVEFSPEDASRSDFDYMCDVLEAVIDAFDGFIPAGVVYDLTFVGMQRAFNVHVSADCAQTQADAAIIDNKGRASFRVAPKPKR